MPKVPTSDNVTWLPQAPPPDKQSLMLAAGMMYQEGKLFDQKELGDQARAPEPKPDLSYAAPKNDWQRIIQYEGKMVDTDKLSPRDLKYLQNRGVKVE